MPNAQALEGIVSGRLERVIIGKLAMNTDLLAGISELVRREGIRAGLILSAVGALREATFRNIKTLPPNLKVKKKHRVYVKLNQQMELVSLTGWVATKRNGDPEVHAHFSVSTVIDGKVTTLGGHLTRGIMTSIKVVVAIGVLDGRGIKAVMDPRIHQIDLKLPT